VANNPVVLCVCTGHEPRGIHKGDHGDIEGVAETHETGNLVRGVDIQNARHRSRLICSDSHAFTIQAGKTNHRVGGEVMVNFKERIDIHYAIDHVPDVVSLVGVSGYQGVQFFVGAEWAIIGWENRGSAGVVIGDVLEDFADDMEGVILILSQEVRDTRNGGVGDGSAQCFVVHDFIGNRFDHFRSGDVHVPHALGHDDKVLQGGRVNAAAGAGSHNNADLRHHTRSLNVAVEYLAIGIQAVDAFLDARAAAVIDANHGHAGVHRQVHHTGNLLTSDFAKRAAHYGEILRVNADFSAVDGAKASDKTVTRDLVFV